MIFTGIGVLLSASTILKLSYLLSLMDHPHIKNFIGRAGGRSEQRHSRGALRSHRVVFFTTRNLYECVADCGNDGHNHADTSRGSQDLWDSDKGVKMGINEWVSDWL